MSELKYKAYIEALSLVNLDVKKAKIFLSDKRMPHQEKTILSCFIALRDFENLEIINILERMNCDDLFIDSQREFCLGAALNNTTRFKEAEAYLQSSILKNKMAGGQKHLAPILELLFTVYQNMNNTAGMELTLTKVKSLPNKTPKILRTILCCDFSLSVLKKNFPSAKNKISEMRRNFDFLNEHQRINFLYHLFSFYLFQDDFSGCEQTIDQLKRFKKYKNPINVKYMQSILNYLKNDTPFYLYEKDFEDFPLMLNQVLCLKGLESGDEEMAMKAWTTLQNIDPLNTKLPFDYTGPANLFSKALSKITRRNEKDLSPLKIKLDPGLTKEKQLLYLLKEASIPLSKETLYQTLWNEEAQSKEELEKLSKLVQRVKQKHQVEIKYLKGAYSLISKKTA